MEVAMKEVFVNPLPNLRVDRFFCFDFPADPNFGPQGPTVPGATITYAARLGVGTCSPNINIEAPGIEQMYGLLGVPGREQGHPMMRELTPEVEDPGVAPHQDQVLDIDRAILIEHTGRLSGSFAKFLSNSNFRSIIKTYAHPTIGSGGTVTLGSITIPLNAQPNVPNVWFRKDVTTREELLCTRRLVISNPAQVGLQRETTYKLVSKWEFWDYGVTPIERMPISGFDEGVGFEVISRTMA